jgi:hexokinase
MKRVQTGKSPKVLVIDVGGTNIKLLATGQKDSRKIASGPSRTASKMVREVKNCETKTSNAPVTVTKDLYLP